MKGLLKAKSATSQLVTLLGVVLVSSFVIGALGSTIVSIVTHVSLEDITKMATAKVIEPRMIPVIRGLQVVQFFALFLVPCIICSYLFSERPARHLGLKPPHTAAFIFAGILLMIIAYPFSGLLGELNRIIPLPASWETWITEKETDAAKSMKAMLGGQNIQTLITNLVVIAGLAAVGEELLLRGMVQRIFTRMFKSPWAGIIISAVLFSALHMQFKGFLPRVALGMILGAVYWYSGSLWVAILAHFFYDAALILLVYFNPSLLEQDTVMDDQKLSLVVMGIISLVLTAGLMRWMILKSKTRYEEVYDEELNAKDHPFENKIR
ncbi:MAG TPA: CPBP family intramembrane glutamic endopeptidase [Chitinophagaceae bacterium]|jgi:hypothetical protein|nr:CPBP family intramembrane glutamic endopeptidase [Chitinophagaceae bacterium]